MTDRNSDRALTDQVIGVFRRDRLSGALAATHRAGFGPHCRVFDGARDDARLQLDRAGLRINGDARPEPDALLVVVSAPGRVATIAELFAELGADAIYLAARREATALERTGSSPLLPDVRIGTAEADAPGL